MKILMIAPTPFFSDRGCHTRILNAIKGLQELGHEVLLCTYGLGKDVVGVNARRAFNFWWYKKVSAGPSVTKILLLPLLFLTVMGSIRRFKPDVVHAFLHEGAFIARFCKIFFKRPLYVFDCQGSLSGEIVQHKFVKQNGILYSLFSFVEKLINNWFPVVTQSEQLVEYLVGTGVKRELILNALDSVDTTMFNPMDKDMALVTDLDIDINKPTLLFMGLLEEYQGADIMFEAYSQVVKVIPESQLLVIGFPNIDKYKNMCISMGIHDNVHFLGKIDYFSVPSYLSLSDIAIAPKISLHEGDGKLYNYMAMGMATIAFDRSVSKEVLGDDENFPTGAFANFNDSIDLANKMIFLLENPDTVAVIGQNARNRVLLNLSHSTQAIKIDAFYSTLLNKNKDVNRDGNRL